MWGVKQLVIFSVVLLVNLPGCSEAGGGAAGGPVVLMATSQGEVKIELFEKEAPETVKNFLAYVNEGFYDGTIFHRVIPGFMIQGGGFTQAMQQKPTKPAIKNEAANGLTNDTGTLTMARTNMVDSATSQFFINVNDNDFLNHKDTSMQGFGYCVFGRVIEGVDVVSAIERVQTGRKGLHADVPQEPIIIQSMKVVSEAQYDAQSES
jgi:cyclophilin family peptidyl-prolyl cis-trans isomerase